MALRAGLQTVAKRNFLSLPGIKLSRPVLNPMTTLTKHLGHMETIYSVMCILGMYMMSFYYSSLCFVKKGYFEYGAV
jgi:hypothetical protein